MRYLCISVLKILLHDVRTHDRHPPVRSGGVAAGDLYPGWNTGSVTVFVWHHGSVLSFVKESMCFLVCAYRQHPRYRLVLVTNRDEFYQRPTAPAAFWDDEPGLLAGRDLQGGGTWMGVTRAGRFAALTNYREPGAHRPDAPTRGALVTGCLVGEDDPRAFLERLQATAGRYNGFNLLAGDADGLYYFSNRASGVRTLAPGLYGLSNHLLDTPWPKLVRGKAALAALLEAGEVDPEALLRLLADDREAPDDALPDTGVGLKWERALSSIFIKSPVYGTRASTLLLIDEAGRVTFIERSYAPQADGASPRTLRFDFAVAPTTTAAK